MIWEKLELLSNIDLPNDLSTFPVLSIYKILFLRSLSRLSSFDILLSGQRDKAGAKNPVRDKNHTGTVHKNVLEIKYIVMNETETKPFFGNNINF